MLSLNFFQVLIFVFLFDYIKCAKKPHERPTEEQRVKQWYEGGNTWPPTWQMETPAMKALLNHREQQILNLTFSAERWENWLQFTQQRMVPRFTQTGFKVLDIPKPQYEKLMEPVRKALEDYDSIGSEGDIDVIYTKDNLKPKFINLKKVADEVHAELTSLHEEWAGGIKLRPTSAYGVRLYQNGSSLVMHYDKVRTHVISSIVHLVHHYDDEENPWPIQIEDHDGNLHDYNLKEGQVIVIIITISLFILL